MNERMITNLELTFNGFASTIDQVLDIVSKSPEGFNASIASFIEEVFNSLLPFGYTLLVLFFILEVINKTMMFENKNYEVFISSLLKLMVAMLVMENSFVLLQVVFEASNGIASLIGNVGVSVAEIDLDPFAEELSSLGFIERILLSVEIWTLSLVMAFINGAVLVIAYGRIVELFMLTAVAPIPLSTLSSQSQQYIGKGFLQTYIGVCLQGAIIVLIVSIYSHMVADNFVVSGEGDFSPMQMLFPLIIFSGVLLTTLVKSGAWAKKIVGTM